MSEVTALALPSEMKSIFYDHKDQIEGALANWADSDRFIVASLTAISRNPKLQLCTKQSLYLNFLECARVGLQPDGKEAVIIPYQIFNKDLQKKVWTAELMPMVSGIIRLMLRSPGVLKVEARVVYEGDHFSVRYGLHPDVDHVPDLDGGDERSITHAYAVGWRQGTEPTFEVMTIEELIKIQSRSKAPDSPAYKFYPGEMYRKIVLKRLSKYFDLSPEATRAIEFDHAIYGDQGIEGSIEGPSEDYQNMITKSRTIARLGTMKEKLATNGNDDKTKEQSENGEEPVEEDPEPQETEETEGEDEKPEARARRAFPVYMIKQLIDQGLANEENHATNILNLFPDLALNTSGARVVELVKIYRQRQKEGEDTDMTKEDIASIAFDEWGSSDG